jgi:hypothetical protein
MIDLGRYTNIEMDLENDIERGGAGARYRGKEKDRASGAFGSRLDYLLVYNV